MNGIKEELKITKQKNMYPETKEKFSDIKWTGPAANLTNEYIKKTIKNLSILLDHSTINWVWNHGSLTIDEKTFKKEDVEYLVPISLFENPDKELLIKHIRELLIKYHTLAEKEAKIKLSAFYEKTEVDKSQLEKIQKLRQNIEKYLLEHNYLPRYFNGKWIIEDILTEYKNTVNKRGVDTISDLRKGEIERAINYLANLYIYYLPAKN